MNALSECRKAIAAAVVALGGALGTAAADGTVSSGEWWVVIGATLVAAGGVWAIPNKGTPADPEV